MRSTPCLTHPENLRKSVVVTVQKPDLRVLGIVTLLIFFFLLLSQSGYARVLADTIPANACPNCTAEDIKVVKVVLTGTNVVACKDSGEVFQDAKVKISLDVTANQRYGLLFVGNLFANGTFLQVVDSCYKRTFYQGPDSVELSIPGFQFKAGVKYEIRNVLTAWDNNKPKKVNGVDVYNPCEGFNENPISFDCKAFGGTGLTPKCKYYEGFTFFVPARPKIISVNITNVFCNGGSNGSIAITRVSPNTQSPFTYCWYQGSPSSCLSTASTLSNVAAGNYTVRVSTTINGQTCTKDSTFNISQPLNPLSATTGVLDANCNGEANGKASVSPTGGTGAYSYVWKRGDTTNLGVNNDTAVNLSAGTYTCKITDANGCFITKTITVDEPTALSATTGVLNANCNGEANGKASVSPTGGTGAYSYVWKRGDTTNLGVNNDTAVNLSAGTYTCTITDANGCNIKKTVVVTEPAVLTATTGVLNANCNGEANGKASVSPTGGTGAYSYVWKRGDTTNLGVNNDTAVNLSAGTYTCTITDANGCNIKKTVVVTEPAVLTATTGVLNANCNGEANGKASVSPTGGTGAYSYVWKRGDTTNLGVNNDTAVNLSAGTYTCTITDANGCNIKKTVVVTEPAVLTATTGVLNANCNGEANGKASVSPTGGTGAYSYVWKRGDTTNLGVNNDTAVNLSAGTYTCTITDANGCNIKKTVVVTEPAALSATKAVLNTSCNGSANGKASVTVTGGTGAYNYVWKRGDTTNLGIDNDTAYDLSAGTYTCTTKDANNCTRKDTLTVGEPSGLSASISNKIDVTCNGSATGSAKVSVSGGTSPYAHKWNTTPPQLTDSAFGLVAGTYTDTVTDAGGCRTWVSVTISQPNALDASASPAETTICESTTTTITVTATGGTTPYQYKLDAGSYQSGNTFSAGTGAHKIVVKDANNCTDTTEVSISGKDCSRFCTYTQGYFGNEGGKSSYDTGSGCQQQQSTRDAIATALNWWTSRGGLKIGNITITNASPNVDTILYYLPGGGPSDQYTGGSLKNAPSNTLLAQTLTLGLNIGLNQYLAGYKFNGKIIAQKTSGSCGQGSTSGTCRTYSYGAPYDTMTVRQLFEAAGEALVSGDAARRSALAGIAGAINEAFDECGKALASCPAVVGTKVSNRTSGESVPTTRIPEKLQVKVYPNPFTSHVYLNFVAPVSGTALIEFFDMSGRRLEVRQRKNIMAGEEVRIEYQAGKAGRSHMIYKVTLGEQSFNGKLFYFGKQ